MRSPCPSGKTRNAKTKACRDKKKVGRKANATRKSSIASKASSNSYASFNTDLRKAKKIFGPSTEYLTVAFAEARIKDKKPVMGMDAQDWSSMKAKDLLVFTFLGFGKDTMMDHKDLSPKLTDEKQTLHYTSDAGELWAYPSGNAANAKDDTLCYGGSCNPIFVIE